MPNRVCCWVAFTTLSLVACLPLTAQESSQHDWYAPLTNFQLPTIPDGKVSNCCGDRFGLKPATYRMKREWAKLRYAKAAEVAPQRMD